MIHLLIHIAELWISCNHSRKRTCCYWGQLYENICSVHSSDQDTKKKMSSCIKRGLWYKAGSIVMPWLCMVCIHLEHCAQLLSPYFISNLLEIESIQKKKAQLWNQWLGNFLDKGKVEISNKHDLKVEFCSCRVHIKDLATAEKTNWYKSVFLQLRCTVYSCKIKYFKIFIAFKKNNNKPVGNSAP